jgi:hypothetical protein
VVGLLLPGKVAHYKRPKPGRGSLEERKDLPVGADFRRLEYRREVFLRFYEFHLENRSHPGCVYYAMPWLAKRHKLDQEQKLWLAFINGNTQNIVTSWIIFQRFPTLGAKGLKAWFEKNYGKLAWDTDRRYHKKEFIVATDCYARLVGSSQKKYFEGFYGVDEKATFRSLWEVLRRDFFTFGRLSAFSYSEYLRIMGVKAECDTLFLRDMSGSKSHRNGLAKVLGREDLDWFRETAFTGDYTEDELVWLEQEAPRLLQEARERTAKNKAIDPREVHYFTLESALCTYKSWHRKNRRYANCYSDMFYNRIRLAEQNYGKEEVAQFWRCREDSQPEHLLLEKNSKDPGLVPAKQNYYRETGHAIMMSKRWPEFDNPFDRNIWS